MTTDRWRRIEALYHGMLARPVHERAAALAAACLSDPALQAEVQSLLDQPASTAGFLSTPAAEVAAHLVRGRSTLLAVGDKLGPYEIVAQIGAGGMGEVYRAHDSRIGRDVAVKVSAERFNERSEREARAVAALNHPNVCTLHDVGPNYLVMELVEGEAPKGPLPLQTALNYARQIADALDAAHEKGIVHRDLKPGNIKIRRDGTVKVLDFGLAKIASPESGEMAHQDLTHSPTMGVTQPGMILGTVAYMAPEQARGKPVDKRADIWAFGVVLYEMLTGRCAFEGQDVSSILAAVIQSEPRWDGVPANVRRLLESCLQKDPRRRLRDIGDVWNLLDDPPTAPSRSRTGTVGWMAAALLAVVAAMALWAAWHGAAPITAQPLVRLDVDLGPDVSLAPLVVPTFSTVVISPDGTRLVYVASVSGGPSRLLTRRLDQPKAAELPGTEGAINPFFSPDGRWVGFWSGNAISKVPVDGGGAVLLGELSTMTGGHWAEQGNLVIGTGSPSSTGVLRMPSTEGLATPMLELASGELWHVSPQILPGGKALLFQAVRKPPSQDNFSVDVVSLADRHRKTLVRGVGSPRYVLSGHLLYTNKSTMFAVPFDLERLETRGTAVAVLDDVAYDAVANGAQFDVSQRGTLVYRQRSGSASSSATVQWLDPTGKPVPLLANPRAYVGTPRVSPDGKRIAIAIKDGADQDIWVYEPQRDAMTRLTLGGQRFTNPVWSRDGRYVVFGSFSGDGVFWSRADGAGQPQVLMSSQSSQFPTSFTSDGKRLAYAQIDGFPQIWTVPIQDDGDGLKASAPERFLTTKFTNAEAAFSPDGRWIAYTSNESGTLEVYVRAFAATMRGGGGRWPISNSGGATPGWSPNGRELLYLAGDQIMTVAYTASGDSFVAEKPRVWAAGVRSASGFDLAPDGRRVAVSVAVGTPDVQAQEHSVVFVMNFFDELRRRAPIGR
jgi:Tol biopolymer transport system component